MQIDLEKDQIEKDQIEKDQIEKARNVSRDLFDMSAMEGVVKRIFSESIELKKKVMMEGHLSVLIQMAASIVESLKNGGKLLLCGNGGSAADAQHLAAELLIRLRPNMNRQCLPAIALAMDPSTLTACGNDFGFDTLYERLVQGLGNFKDVLLGITTSGRSPNVIRALKMAQSLGMVTLGFLGNEGGEALNYCDLAFVVPGKEVGRIQELHITAGHAVMEMVEEMMLQQGEIKLLSEV